MDNYNEYSRSLFIQERKELAKTTDMYKEKLASAKKDEIIDDKENEEMFEDEYEKELDHFSPTKSIMSPMGKDAAGLSLSLKAAVQFSIKKGKKSLRKSMIDPLKREKQKQFEKVCLKFLNDPTLAFGKANLKE